MRLHTGSDCTQDEIAPQVARVRFRDSDEPNRHAFHDVGLAMGNLLAEATVLNVGVHQMAGIGPERARREFDIPEEFEVVSGVAMGYVGDPSELPDEERRSAELAARKRLALPDLVFGATWGRVSPVIESTP